MRKILTKIILLSGVAVLPACTVGPDYHRPDVSVAGNYKELGNWRPAHPADISRGPWWEIYNDPVLNALEKQVLVSNQNLKASEAAYNQAQAAVQQAQASFFPVITLNGSGEKKHAATGTATTTGLSTAASWAPDVWGRTRQTVTAQKATAEASAADLAGATLSAQGTLATDYFELRATDQLQRLLNDTVAADKRSLKIAQNQYKTGLTSKADVVQAQAQLDQIISQAINVGVQRAQLEHAIAVLVGRTPADFSLVPAGDLPDVPVVPAGIPSALLERRPDIAAAERRVAAANAEIGVAETAYFPDLTLAASGGYTAPVFGQLLRASNEVWSLGPSLALTLFDGGAREAQVKAANAAYDQQVALYRQTALTGFQQVEDQLASLRILEQQEKVQSDAVHEAKEATRIITNQYNEGIVAYTSVITTQTQELASRQTALSIRENSLVASVGLIEALGGEWNSGASPQN